MKVYPVFEKENQTKIEQYLKIHNPRNYLIWMIGCHTGLRISDILKLKPSDLKNGAMHVHEQKTGKTLRVIVSGKLNGLLKNFIAHCQLQENDLIFQSRQSKGNPMSVRRVQQIMKSVARSVKISENINTHTMRKTFAYNLYQLSNHNIALVMEALNHTKESITLRYLCVKDHMLKNFVELL